MRLLIVAAISMPMLISGAFAESDLSTATPSDRAAAARRETGELEKARLIDAMRHSTLRMQAQSQELEKLGQQTRDACTSANANSEEYGTRAPRVV